MANQTSPQGVYLSRNPRPAYPFQAYQLMPKVDLHRHLEGSLRLRTMAEIARQYGIKPPVTAQLRPLVQVQPQEEYNFRNFLAKFQTLRQFYRSLDIITRITHEAVADAAEDNLHYLELRFTPVALARDQSYSLADAMDVVCDSLRQASATYNLPARLIASVNRHEPLEVAETVAQLAADRRERGICGLDLAGNEAEFSALPFAPLFREAKAAGLRVTVHAGEWAGAESVRAAIEDLGAERIGHGVRVLEDPAIVALARERQIPFEVCITSNFQTGVVPSLERHPLLRMIEAGLNVTLNTDDPSISQITLSDDYRLAVHSLGMSVDQLETCILRGGQAAFLPDLNRLALLSRLRESLDALKA